MPAKSQAIRTRDFPQSILARDASAKADAENFAEWSVLCDKQALPTSFAIQLPLHAADRRSETPRITRGRPSDRRGLIGWSCLLERSLRARAV